MTDTPENRPTILIADDNPQIVELLEAYLEPAGANISTARDGQEVVDRIAERRPNLILLDVMMPKRSGFEVCRDLKNNPELRDIPVIIITALNEFGDIERGRESGADAFLSKPVNKLELLEHVRRLLAVR